jgi:benzoyl-CoA reductase/2-hydroxyglutaryl-CoA dehydratase subunit BcrC/BadD/HgdB
MDEQTDDPDDAVMRLENALERIAQMAGHRGPAVEPRPAVAEAEDAAILPVDEITARLDQLIDRLRAAVGSRSG